MEESFYPGEFNFTLYTDINLKIIVKTIDLIETLKYEEIDRFGEFIDMIANIDYDIPTQILKDKIKILNYC